MSLDYNLGEIKEHGNYAALWDGDDYMNDWVRNIIFATMTVNIGYIQDEVTAAKFWARAKTYDTLMGWEPSFTPQQVHTMIGLRTNVATMTDTQWLKRVKERAGQLVAGAMSEYYEAINPTTKEV